MPARSTLPIDDYDHLQVGSLISRIRTLDSAGLQTLLEYEQKHANRVQVVSAMRSRLSGLKEGAQPSGGDPNAASPESAPPPDAGSAPAATSAPPVNPPSHGDPTNPAQPR